MLHQRGTIARKLPANQLKVAMERCCLAPEEVSVDKLLATWEEEALDAEIPGSEELTAVLDG
uniref:Uncharacterized protein n=1 Tax=Arundo donax TaxID=35708 RepID=A0A0A8YPX6_ARUDO